jgi:8-oxo-dGTP diphosphatase
VTTGAAAIVFDADGRVLVVKENYDRHRWSFPGGRVEDGESPEQACVREAREETGAELSDVCWLAPLEIPQPQSNILHYALPDALAGRRGVDRDALPRVS